MTMIVPISRAELHQALGLPETTRIDNLSVRFPQGDLQLVLFDPRFDSDAYVYLQKLDTYRWFVEQREHAHEQSTIKKGDQFQIKREHASKAGYPGPLLCLDIGGAGENGKRTIYYEWQGRMVGISETMIQKIGATDTPKNPD